MDIALANAIPVVRSTIGLPTVPLLLSVVLTHVPLLASSLLAATVAILFMVASALHHLLVMQQHLLDLRVRPPNHRGFMDMDSESTFWHHFLRC